MRLILDSHPNSWVFGEPTAHWLLDNNHLDDVDKAVERWCSKINVVRREKILEEVKELKKKNLLYFGYTTPGWTELFLEYDCIKNKLKEIPKIIFMIRNPFDVVSSIIKLNDFAVTTIKTMELWMTDSNRIFKKRYFKFLHKDDNFWKVRWFAVYWNYKTQAYFDMQKDPYYNALGVRYEELCTQPKNTVSKICEFLGMSWHDDLLNHECKKHFETINNVTNGGTVASRGIDLSSLNKNEITQAEREVILEVNEELISQIGSCNDFRG